MKLNVSFYYVGDIGRAMEIYSCFLGTPPIYVDHDWVRFHLEGGDLALHHSANLQQIDITPSVRYGAIVSFTVMDIHHTLARAKVCGFRALGDVNSEPFGKLAHICDPWGNVISLLEPSSG